MTYEEMTQGHWDLWNQVLKWIKACPAWKQLPGINSSNYLNIGKIKFIVSMDKEYNLQNRCYPCDYYKMDCWRCPIGKALGSCIHTGSVYSELLVTKTKTQLLKLTKQIRDVFKEPK